MKAASVTFGKYINTNSVIHRLNPLTKFIGFTIMLILTFWGHMGFEQFFYLCIAVVILFKVSKIPLLMLLSQWRNILFLFIFIFLIGAVFSFGGHNGAHTGTDNIGKWHIPSQNLPNAIFIVGRIFLIINIAGFLTSTSTSSEITSAILYLLKPFRLIKMPVDEIALMVSIALRFIPTFISEADIIMKAQASRGLDITTKNPRRKVTAFVALIVPLFLSAFTKAEELSSAMDSRGYIVGARRTRMRKFALTYHDGVFIVLMGAFFIFIIVSLHFLVVVNSKSGLNLWFKSFWNWWGWRQPIL